MEDPGDYMWIFGGDAGPSTDGILIRKAFVTLSMQMVHMFW